MISKISNMTLGIFLVLTLSTGLVFDVNTDTAIKRSIVEKQTKRMKTRYSEAAVSADGLPCPTIGTDILREGGNAIDSAIGTLFCLGVVITQSVGLGGGFFLTYYNRTEQKAYLLDSRETAPSSASEIMFAGNAKLSSIGGLAVAVPGEMRGYWEAYKRFGGGVSWKRLIEPTINLCENGFPVNSHMANALSKMSSNILSTPSMSVFINSTTGEVLQKGDILKRPVLAKTLRELQCDPDSVHTGSLAKEFLQDLVDLGSIITKDDMEGYKPIWRDTYPVKLGNSFTLYSTPPPGSGLILGYMLNILGNFNFSKESLNEVNKVQTYQRIVETFKFAYAKRTLLGDMDYSDQMPLINDLISEEMAYETYLKINTDTTSQDPMYYGSNYSFNSDHGTSHMSVLAPNGDAVAVTSTVNIYFGANIMSNSTGILLNDEMDDFSSPDVINKFNLPPFSANFIEPGKRPASSMCPAIIIDESGDVVLAIGAAGGTRIPSSTAWAIAHNLWFGKDMTEAITTERLHHQLYPMKLSHENGFDKDVLEALRQMGHLMDPVSDTGVASMAAVTGIRREDDGTLDAFSDPRKGGGDDGY